MAEQQLRIIYFNSLLLAVTSSMKALHELKLNTPTLINFLLLLLALLG
jgi:hypothetical protein